VSNRLPKTHLRSAKHKARLPPPSKSRALIRLDTAKLRTKAFAALRKAEQAFEEADRTLKEFERVELRAFERWKHLSLGPTLTELHRVLDEVNEAEFHLARAEEEQWRTGLPLWKAFERWKREEETRRLHPEPPPEATAEDDPDLSDEELRRIFDESPLSDLVDELGLDLDDLSAEELKDILEGNPPPRPHGKTPRPDLKPRKNDTLRQHYRQLCRLLHPDSAGELTEEQRATWHQVQEAYAHGDAVRLETILARVQQAAGHALHPRTLAELKDAAHHFRQARERLRSLIAEARRHPAWNFSARGEPERKRLEREFRREIECDCANLRRRLAEIRAALRPRTDSTRRAARSRRSDSLDLFF
jgi:hypothetical protein